jgi:hypothetical protein
MRRRPQAALAASALPTQAANTSTLWAHSIDFGVAVSGSTMQIMQTVEAAGNVRLTLKAGDFKEIEIQVPLLIDGRRQNSKFQLPLSLVETIYKVKDSLVIPFKSVSAPLRRAAGTSCARVLTR